MSRPRLVWEGCRLCACTAPGGAQDTSWCPVTGTSHFTPRTLSCLGSPGSNNPSTRVGSAEAGLCVKRQPHERSLPSAAGSSAMREEKETAPWEPP